METDPDRPPNVSHALASSDVQASHMTSGPRPDVTIDGNDISQLPTRPNIDPTWPSHHLPEPYRSIYLKVQESGVFNHLHCRIPLPSSLKMDVWRHLADVTDLPDKTLCDYLDFGYPAGTQRPVNLHHFNDNHASAFREAEKVDSYIKTETEHLAILGPMPEPPFIPWVQINPLMTKDKRLPGGKIKTRIITDLSWPPGSSVNDAIDPDVYMGESLKFKLPQSDNLMNMIIQHGRGCYMYSHDISRAYRVLRLEPLSWPLFGLCCTVLH